MLFRVRRFLRYRGRLKNEPRGAQFLPGFDRITIRYMETGGKTSLQDSKERCYVLITKIFEMRYIHEFPEYKILSFNYTRAFY